MFRRKHKLKCFHQSYYNKNNQSKGSAFWWHKIKIAWTKTEKAIACYRMWLSHQSLISGETWQWLSLATSLITEDKNQIGISSSAFPTRCILEKCHSTPTREFMLKYRNGMSVVRDIYNHQMRSHWKRRRCIRTCWTRQPPQAATGHIQTVREKQHATPAYM